MQAFQDEKDFIKSIQVHSTFIMHSEINELRKRVQNTYNHNYNFFVVSRYCFIPKFHFVIYRERPNILSEIFYYFHYHY